MGTQDADPTQGEGMATGGRSEDYRAGFACLVGRPNAGKSTLTNALVGQKVAITSSKPQTTRHTIRGVATTPTAQVILVDTPGLHKPRTLLGERLNDLVRETLLEVDVIGFCLPADQRIGPGDTFIANELTEQRLRLVQPRSVDQHELGVLPVQHAAHDVAGRLRPAAGDGDFCTHQRVGQGGLAGVGPAHEAGEPAPEDGLSHGYSERNRRGPRCGPVRSRSDPGRRPGPVRP